MEKMLFSFALFSVVIASFGVAHASDRSTQIEVARCQALAGLAYKSCQIPRDGNKCERVSTRYRRLCRTDRFISRVALPPNENCAYLLVPVCAWDPINAFHQVGTLCTIDRLGIELPVSRCQGIAVDNYKRK